MADALEAVATKVYRADGVDFTPAAKRQLAELRENGFGNLPVCVAKTQYSFSDNAKALGAPEGFRITVRELKVSAGAHFVVALTGSVLTMPGLPKVPAAENIDVDNDAYLGPAGLFDPHATEENGSFCGCWVKDGVVRPKLCRFTTMNRYTSTIS